MYILAGQRSASGSTMNALAAVSGTVSSIVLALIGMEVGSGVGVSSGEGVGWRVGVGGRLVPQAALIRQASSRLIVFRWVLVIALPFLQDWMIPWVNRSRGEEETVPNYAVCPARCKLSANSYSKHCSSERSCGQP
jgi:hypothetical protein